MMPNKSDKDIFRTSFQRVLKINLHTFSWRLDYNVIIVSAFSALHLILFEFKSRRVEKYILYRIFKKENLFRNFRIISNASDMHISWQILKQGVSFETWEPRKTIFYNQCEWNLCKWRRFFDFANLSQLSTIASLNTDRVNIMNPKYSITLK